MVLEGSCPEIGPPPRASFEASASIITRKLELLGEVEKGPILIS